MGCNWATILIHVLTGTVNVLNVGTVAFSLLYLRVQRQPYRWGYCSASPSPVSLSEIWCRSGVPIAGEQAAILEPFVDRVPWSVIQWCGAAVLRSEKGWRFEVGGGRQKGRMSNFKVQNPNDK